MTPRKDWEFIIMANAREERKLRRIQMLKTTLQMDPERTTPSLISTMIVNFGVSKKTALEEIEAVKMWMEEGQSEAEEPVATDEVKAIMGED